MLNHRVERLQVGILFREVAKRAIHLETDLEVCLRVPDVAEERFVAPHIVIIDRLLQQGDGTSDQQVSGFRGFAELVQTEPGMKKTCAGVRGDSTKLLTYAEGERPSLLAHEMMEPKLKYFGTVLKAFINGIELSERLAGHTELCVAAGRLQLPFELHE